MNYVATLTNPVSKIGQYSFTGIIDTYFNAEMEIGAFTSIAPPLYIHGATEHPCVFEHNLVSTFPFGDKWDVPYPKAKSKGKIIIGNDVWIGESCTILSGRKIGDGAIVGARSVIAKDIAPYAIVAGNPARFVRYRFSKSIVRKLVKIAWWTWTREQIEENLELMKDVKAFVKKYDVGYS